jgi:methylase of polypeptide subunit release factors
MIIDLQHHLFLLTLDGKLYNAPIQDLPGGLHNVLDIGTGTGIWAIDFGKSPNHHSHVCLLTIVPASEFPSANVIGIDLSPIQPQLCVHSSPI